MNDFKKSDTWEIQLTMVIKFMPSKDINYKNYKNYEN